ncbi:hypothetical protein [Bremerella cremea]|uniref:hypothetical protein n=1 Tax=Bremerella cremea TaxID=1031537 RepID=UPI0031E5880B
MARVLFIFLLVLFALWLGTSVELPAPPQGAEANSLVIWRRTESGWIRAESWLVSRDHLNREPTPPLYPVAALPMIITLSIGALLIGQPKESRDQILDQ